MIRRVDKAMAVCAVLWMTGCAQVGSPDGGGRDEEAPQVVLADPPFGTVRFDRSEFILEFDEFVQLQDARRQMLVSPPLPSLPKALVRGRSVKVELGDSLMPDRTYIVQFGDAVRDLREGNVAKGLQYVFTTGDVLDSGRVAGRAEDAWSGEASAGTRVLLFDGGLPEGVLDAGLPDSLRPLPDYVGLVDDSGRFDVGFLPISSLGWMVVDDVNGNYRADQGEAVGWSSEAIQTVTDSVDWAHLLAAPPLMLDAPPAVASTYLSGVLVDSSGYFRAAISGLDAVREGPDGLTDADIRDSVALTGPDGPVDFGLEGDSVWASLPGYEAGEGGPWLLQHLSGTDTLGVSRGVAQHSACPCWCGGTVRRSRGTFQGQVCAASCGFGYGDVFGNGGHGRGYVRLVACAVHGGREPLGCWSIASRIHGGLDHRTWGCPRRGWIVNGHLGVAGIGPVFLGLRCHSIAVRQCCQNPRK